MRGAYVLACHTGVQTYAAEFAPWTLNAYALTPNPLGILTTKFMGATKGDENWDLARSHMSGNILEALRGSKSLTEDHILWTENSQLHRRIGLIYRTKALNQRWNERGVAFISWPAQAGLYFGALRNRVEGYFKANGTWAYKP